jgi:hypothetical protein
MARHLKVYNYVNIIGKIWLPPVTCAMSYSPRTDDVRDEDGNITRESIEQWLLTHSGDFQCVEDFEANIADGDKDILIPWQSEESEFTYNDCVYGSEEEA